MKTQADSPKKALSGELYLAGMLAVLVCVLIAPIPPKLFDLLLVVNLVGTVLILLVAARVGSVLQLLTFPALILISTMLRLSLNVASTKMILLHGQAGSLIEAFGRVIVGGNVLVGLCVFLIVALVQLIVVAKGSERVAEVAARFALDAMPGKQMSIDAELRGGNISADEARQRRERLDIESRMLGGMDGAMKFVKGDAVAGLAIALVNLVGGLASGVFQKGMSFGDAVTRYSTLSIGDAIASQVPSLMIALAAGLVITRVSGGGESGSIAAQIGAELRSHPGALVAAAAAALLLAFVPGFPHWAFALTGVVLGVFGFRVMRGRKPPIAVPVGGDRAAMPAFSRSSSEPVPDLVAVRGASFDGILEILVPRALIATIDAPALNAAIQVARHRISTVHGVVYPGLRLYEHVVPASGGGRADSDASRFPVIIRINGVTVASFLWDSSKRLDVADFDENGRNALGIPGWRTAAWVETAIPQGSDSSRVAVSMNAPPPSVTAGHVTLSFEAALAASVEALCVLHVDKCLTMELVHDLMLEVRNARPKLVDELAPNVPLHRLTDVLRRLSKEGLSIRKLPLVCEVLLDEVPGDTSPPRLAEVVLRRLASIRADGDGAKQQMNAYVAGPGVSALLTALASRSSATGAIALPAAFTELTTRLRELATTNSRGFIFVVCRADLRASLSELCLSCDRRFRVYAYDGIPPETAVHVIETIDITSVLPDEFSDLFVPAPSGSVHETSARLFDMSSAPRLDGFGSART